jgi:hypothetical protein
MKHYSTVSLGDGNAVVIKVKAKKHNKKVKVVAVSKLTSVYEAHRALAALNEKQVKKAHRPSNNK